MRVENGSLVWICLECLHYLSNSKKVCTLTLYLDEKIKNPQKLHGDSLVVQMVKNLTAMWETQLQTLGQQDPLEKGMATHSSIHA